MDCKRIKLTTEMKVEMKPEIKTEPKKRKRPEPQIEVKRQKPEQYDKMTWFRIYGG